MSDKVIPYPQSQVEPCGCVKDPSGHRFTRLCPEHIDEVLATDPLIAGSARAVHALDAIFAVYGVGSLADFECIPVPREILIHIQSMAKAYLEELKREQRS